jgi:beta-aspartyl-dipeptidase (metallo-type)
VPPSILWRDIVRLARDGVLSWPDAIALGSRNVARVLGLSARKGVIRAGADADIVLADADDRVDTVLARGRILVRQGRPLALGPYERDRTELA